MPVSLMLHSRVLVLLNYRFTSMLTWQLEKFIFGNRSGIELKVMFWEYELSFASVWYVDWDEKESMFETACCFSLVFSCILRHLSDLWSVHSWSIHSWIIFSGISASYSSVTPVAQRLWFIWIFPSLHTSGSICDQIERSYYVGVLFSFSMGRT